MFRPAHLLLIAAVLLFGGTAVSAQQPLIASAWYAVVYQPETDTLRWINAQGEQGQMPRPHLPDEIDYRDMRIAPDGRTMVMVSQLNTGNLALGIYDFASGLFKAIHTAQPGETIELGGENIFSADSQHFAVGFFSGNFASPAWRVILFQSQTGNSAAFIDHTHPDAPSVPLSAPAVQYIDATHVHFQLLPQGVSGWEVVPAYSWRVFSYAPDAPLIDVSPYTSADVQIHPQTGAVLDDASLPFDPQQFVRVIRASEGYVLLSDINALLHTNGIAPVTAQTIAQLTPTSEVIYVTPIGATFALGQIPNNGVVQIATPTNPPVVIVPPAVVITPTAPAPPPVVPVACATVLTPRIAVGGMARVVLTTPTLNVRQQPGGAIQTTFGPGTTFYVIGGSACVQDLIWWQIERYGMVGWVAEGVSGSYLIEPYAGPMSLDPSPTPVIVVSPPPAEPPPLQLVCGQALPPRLTIGGSATILSTSRPHNGPGGSSMPLRFYQEGTQVTVNAGPECVDGQFWWLINGQARIGRIGRNFEQVQAWVPESSNTAYFLSP